MKRKETLLETNLIKLGYHLSHKTYTGKHSDKVDTYVYQKENEVITYSVALNKTREKIVDKSFTNHRVLEYTRGILDSLEEISGKFEEELASLFVVLETTIENHDPFVEESNFDGND